MHFDFAVAELYCVLDQGGSISFKKEGAEEAAPAREEPGEDSDDQAGEDDDEYNDLYALDWTSSKKIYGLIIFF